jgi:tRNA (cmo5U34)-methyltransferase
MGSVGDGLKAGNACWTFGEGVAAQFDEHVSKSVPLYAEGHDLVCALSDFFVKPDSTVYELGCSTGALTCKLARHNSAKKKARFLGIDIEQEMIDQANQRRTSLALTNTEFVVDDALIYPFEPADLIVAYYTVQFVRPSHRQQLFDLVYRALNWGGAFILFEKVRAPDARFQDITTALYMDYKLEQGYSPEEISAKNRSLKGVLEPFSTQGNLDLLARAGFVDTMTVMKYICFEGFLAIK